MFDSGKEWQKESWTMYNVGESGECTERVTGTNLSPCWSTYDWAPKAPGRWPHRLFIFIHFTFISQLFPTRKQIFRQHLTAWCCYLMVFGFAYLFNLTLIVLVFMVNQGVRYGQTTNLLTLVYLMLFCTLSNTNCTISLFFTHLRPGVIISVIRPSLTIDKLALAIFAQNQLRWFICCGLYLLVNGFYSWRKAWFCFVIVDENTIRMKWTTNLQIGWLNLWTLLRLLMTCYDLWVLELVV